MRKIDKRILFYISAALCISWDLDGIATAVTWFDGKIRMAIGIIPVLYYCLYCKKKDSLFTRIIFAFLTSFALFAVFGYLTGFESHIYKGISYIFIIDSLMIAKVVIDEKLDTRPLLFMIVADFFFKSAVTLSRYDSNPTLMKEAGVGYLATRGINHVIIQYQYVYIIPPLLLLALCRFFNSKELKIRIFWGGFVAVCLVILFKSQMTMMYLLLPIALILYHAYKKRGRITAALVAACAALLVIWFNLTAIITRLLRLDFLGNTVKNRLNGVLKIVNGGDEYVSSHYKGSMTMGDSAVNRVVAYERSFRAFFSNFFLGYFTPGRLAAGAHSSWIDVVCFYGIFVAIPVYVMFIASYKWMRRQLPENHVEIDTIFIYLIISGLLSNISFLHVYMVLFVFITAFLYKKPTLVCQDNS